MDAEEGEQQTNIEIKIVILGNASVGKTSICSKFATDDFHPGTKSTIGASFLTKKMTINNVKVKMQLWDTAGQERFRSMAPMYYRGADIALCVFDLTSMTSFDAMKGWVSEVLNHSPKVILCICGNKLDLVQESVITNNISNNSNNNNKSGSVTVSGEPRVDSNLANKFAESKGCKYFECSAKTGDNIQDIFLYVVRRFISTKIDNKYSDKSNENGAVNINSDKINTKGSCC
eukprot:c40807_g1_i1.p1 GENE.c40807_g1_i1~~c40807_g1_i1.p1  ORF type:complete len:232 (-),score=6.46 c40807_g1_i1:41-736(-)